MKNTNKETENTNEWLAYYAEHTNKDYPVGVYYVDLSKMFMGSVRLHWHEEIEIDFVKSGKAVFALGDEKITVNEGSAILINSGRIHSIYNSTDKNCVIISVLFNIGYLFDNSSSFLSHKYMSPIIDNSAFSHVLFSSKTKSGRIGIECINSIMKTNLDKKYGYELSTKSLLCNLWIQLLDIASEKNDTKVKVLSLLDEQRVRDAITYINSNYTRPLTLEEISDNIHISKSECCRCFKRATDMTPFEYIMNQRIFESARKMQRDDPVCASISELARSVGFNNASYYNKIFKKYFKDTPLKCKEILKKSHRDSLSPFGIALSRM